MVRFLKQEACILAGVILSAAEEGWRSGHSTPFSLRGLGATMVRNAARGHQYYAGRAERFSATFLEG